MWGKLVHTVRWQRQVLSRRWNHFHHPRWLLRLRFERKRGTIREVIQSGCRALVSGSVGNAVITALVLQFIVDQTL
jgi:hypothetical protein